MDTGLAILGIWIGVGLVGLADTQGWSAIVAFFAMLSTLFVIGIN